MILDLLSKLPFLNHDDVDEVDEEQAKRDRIAFHRDHVRNGPANFKTQSSGQVRRAKTRALAGRAKKARRHQVQTFFANQREHAVLRGHLQAVGVLPYHESAPASVKVNPDGAVRATRAIVHQFGDLTDSEDTLVRNALQRAYDRFCALSGVETSEIEYTS